MAEIIAKDRINVFAKTNFRNREMAFGIKKDDRRRHVYIIGKTGMGKTTMIENMIVQDILAGNGIAFVDPHGESVEKILNYIPTSRVNDVVYFNPADLDYPIAFNPLESVDPKYKHLVASGLMGVFTKIWANVWSARMEYILNNTILALLDTPGNTMLGIARMLVDKKFRKKIVDNVRDPIVKSFWIDEFANYNDKFRNEAIAPIQNKVGQFLSSAIIRNIVGQPKSTIDLREIMDNKKILLLNLSKGRIGEDNSALLGAMFITKLQLAAMSRVDVLEEEREDFYLYVDEFQNFATESFATILSEARKYRLNLIIAHQYVGQLITETGNTKIKDAVFGNVGTLIIFRVGATDAEELEPEFAPTFEAVDFLNLTKYHIYLKLMINGTASQPFSAVTLPPLAEKTANQDKIMRVSRERYSKPRDQIEEKITRWMGQEYHQEAAQQDLTIEEEEQERGGVIFTPHHMYGDATQDQQNRRYGAGFTGKTGADRTTETSPPSPREAAQKKPPQPPPRPVSPLDKGQGPVRQKIREPKPDQPKPQPKPDAFKPAENPIWQKVAQDTERKTEDNIKNKLKSLVFKFGEEASAEETKHHETVESKLKQLQEKTLSPKSVKPGETIKF